MQNKYLEEDFKYIASIEEDDFVKWLDILSQTQSKAKPYMSLDRLLGEYSEEYYEWLASIQ